MNEEQIEVRNSSDGHEVPCGRCKTCETADILLGRARVGDLSQVVGSSAEVQMAVAQTLLERELKITNTMANIKYTFVTKDGHTQEEKVARLNYDEITDSVILEVPAGVSVIIKTY